MQTILLIEDEAALQKTLGEVFKQEGYNMISALNGEIGIRMARDKKPDLILLDLIMPQMNGFEVLKALKQIPEAKDIPVIVLTNLESMADINKAIELGATTYLVKAHYSLKDIISKVNDTLAKAASKKAGFAEDGGAGQEAPPNTH